MDPCNIRNCVITNVFKECSDISTTMIVFISLSIFVSLCVLLKSCWRTARSRFLVKMFLIECIRHNIRIFFLKIMVTLFGALSWKASMTYTDIKILQRSKNNYSCWHMVKLFKIWNLANMTASYVLSTCVILEKIIHFLRICF